MSFPERKQTRLGNYDYSLRGGYFVTICSHQRLPLFGQIKDYTMIANTIGLIASLYWKKIPKHFNNVSLDAFIIMPNHIHGIVQINEQTRSTLGQIIGWYKFQAMEEINRLRGQPGQPVWQRGYYDHIIRQWEDVKCIRDYILGNPAKWSEDEYNRMYGPSEAGGPGGGDPPLR